MLTAARLVVVVFLVVSLAYLVTHPRQGLAVLAAVAIGGAIAVLAELVRCAWRAWRRS